jgi:undecaprenyl-diphosphatase
MNWNQKLFFKINGLAGKSKVLDIVSVFGGRWLVYLLITLYLVLVINQGLKVDSLLFLGLFIFGFAWLVGWVMSLSLGLIIKEQRPFIKYPQQVKSLYKPLFESWKSFPSDHSMTVFVIFFLFVKLNLLLALVILPFCLLVGWGRIYGGVHYPADILGGIAVASLSVFMTFMFGVDLLISLFKVLGL